MLTNWEFPDVMHHQQMSLVVAASAVAAAHCITN